ncbi:MAG: phosphate/phosphite/phosphonate ABC transporter substrate-binding protein [Nitrospiraceae bacterium]|nr:phosphate/phosphite/phosphonate ABC transporter substrate-binding protein [Nitrospiraceae bacterium]
MKRIAGVILIFLSVALFPPQAVYSQASPKKILIGILPEMNVFKQKHRFKLLGEYLSKKTGVTIEITILSKYTNIIDRFHTQKMDGAFFGSFTGALAIRKLGVVPLARPVDLDNRSTYCGYLFVRKDGGIRTVKDMKGKKMAYVDRATTAGYVFPQAFLRKNGVMDTDHFFGEYFFTGSHDAAIDAVLDRNADIGAAKNTIYDRLRRENPRVDRELLVLAKSAHVPENGLCVRKDLDDALKQKLKQALLEMDGETEGKDVLRKFGAIRFVATRAEDYQPVFQLVKEAGIVIKPYEYLSK